MSHIVHRREIKGETDATVRQGLIENPERKPTPFGKGGSESVASLAPTWNRCAPTDYRCYPNAAQRRILARTFGATRYVYNWALRMRTDASYERQERIYYKGCSACLTQLKKQPETLWLNEISSVPAQQALRHLDTAFRTFFAGRTAYPSFKRKHGQQSAEYTVSGFRFADGRLTLAKMDSPLKIRWSRPLPNGAKPSTATVSRDSAGRYFVSLRVTDDIHPLPKSDAVVGIDLGIASLVTLSTGEKVGNPRHRNSDAKRQRKAQQSLSRKQKGSKGREKARLRLARVEARIADRRRDFTDKLTTRLVRENQTICCESLRVKTMVRNHTLAKQISDAGWGNWYGNSTTKRRGTDGRSSPLIAAIRVASGVRTAATSFPRFLSTFGTGCVPSAVPGMTGM